MEKTTANCIPKQAHGYTESWERLLPVAREQRVPPPRILASENHSQKKKTVSHATCKANMPIVRAEKLP
jgi:hypothetical protein